MKKLQELNGIKVLTKKEQKFIKGGLACRPDGGCPSGTHCCYSGQFEGLCRKTC